MCSDGEDMPRKRLEGQSLCAAPGECLNDLSLARAINSPSRRPPGEAHWHRAVIPARAAKQRAALRHPC